MKACEIVLSELRSWIEASCICVPADDGSVYITSPLQYADGDHPEIHVQLHGDGHVTLTDEGEAFNRLDLQQIAVDTTSMRRRILEISRGYGVDLVSNSHLQLDVAQDRLGQAISAFAAALVQIDALSAFRKQPAEPRFDRELADYLIDTLPFPVVRRAEVTGRTGKRYRLTCQTRAPRKHQMFVQAIGSANHVDDNRAVDHAFRVYSDIQGSFARRYLITVLKDQPSAYVSADLDLLESVSTIGTWEDRGRLINYLSTEDMPPSNRLYIPTPALF